MSQTISDVFVEHLVQAGVQRIYGIVGDSLNPVVDAVRRNGKLQWVHVRHEEEAAFAAGAEAQLSGHLTACAGSCGPGNVHLINGLYDAHRSNAPVLALAAQIPSHEIGTMYFQETHPERMFQECSYYCELISNPGQMPRVLQIAMQTAISKQGVAVVTLPGDIAALPMPDEALVHAPMTQRPGIRPSDASIAQLADLINAAQKITLFCGIGAAGAHDELLALAKALQAPVASTVRGKTSIEYDNPYAVGLTGLIGGKAAYNAMHTCDLLLLLGTDFPYEAFLPTKARIAQIDIRAENLGRRSRLDLGLWGDIRETINALLPQVLPKQDGAFLQKALHEAEEMRRTFDVYVNQKHQRRPIRPEYVTALLSDLASDDAVFTADTGMPTVWAARYLKATKERRLIGSFNHGSMANALPQAIGAQFLSPNRQVISLSGDGGFAMLMGGLLTVLQYDLPLKILIFNNSQLDLVKMEMEVAGYPEYQTELKNPNFAKVAEAVGLLGIRIEDPADVRPGLQKMLAHAGPVVVDVVVDPNALALPPHITFEQARGYALSMTKLMLTGRADEVVDIVSSTLPEMGGTL
jgi:pyruvate dehydrogenase (quinone)